MTRGQIACLSHDSLIAAYWATRRQYEARRGANSPTWSESWDELMLIMGEMQHRGVKP